MTQILKFSCVSFSYVSISYVLAVQLPFELPVQMPVQLLLELKRNLLAQNVIGLEFELSRM